MAAQFTQGGFTLPVEGGVGLGGPLDWELGGPLWCSGVWALISAGAASLVCESARTDRSFSCAAAVLGKIFKFLISVTTAMTDSSAAPAGANTMCLASCRLANATDPYRTLP